MSFWQSLTRPVIGMAPMDGVTDATFRHTVAMHGKPDVSFTEFTHVHDVCRGPEFLLDSLIYHEAERPIVAQLYGKEPDLFYQAAHAVCELGFDGLDINMGCPSRSVASSGSGAGLIRTPDVAQAIMQAARQGIADWAAGQTLEGAGLKPGRVAAIRRMNEQRQDTRPLVRHTIPLSVKTRLGYDVVVVDRLDRTSPQGTAGGHFSAWPHLAANVSRGSRLECHCPGGGDREGERDVVVRQWGRAQLSRCRPSREGHRSRWRVGRTSRAWSSLVLSAERGGATRFAATSV